jgi:hypothetical protein
MFRISLFKVGLVAMLFFVFASNVLNYVSIATTVWGEDNQASISLWSACNPYNLNNYNRAQCLHANPPALLATGTALNCLALVLIAIAQIALFSPRFKDSFALYFVIGSEISVLLSLIFNAIGWFFVFIPQYQLLKISSNDSFPLTGFRLGWSFWLMTPSFATAILAAIIGSAILGCTCVENRVARTKDQALGQLNVKNTSYTLDNNQVFYDYKASDQVLRL